MATLYDVKHVERVAWNWEGMTRIYECDTLEVTAEYKIERWAWASGTKGMYVRDVWLYFVYNSRYMRRAGATTSASGNDWIDVVNVLNDPTVDVSFFPIYDVDSVVSYEVQGNMEEQQVLEVNRQLTVPNKEIRMEVKSSLDLLPSWLASTRYTNNQ